MRKLAIVSFSFAAAVFMANYLLPEAALLPIGGALFLLCLMVWTWGSGKNRRRARKVALCCAGLAVGCLWMALYTAIFFQPARNMDDRTVLLEATVAEWPEQEAYGWSVLVRAKTDSPVSVRTILYTDEQGAELRPGDRIATVAHCTLGDQTFSGESITYYTAKGVFLRAQAYGGLEISRPDTPSPRYWTAILAKELRESIAHAFDENTAPLVRALVTGNRDHLTDAFTSSLQRTGLSHTVAVSGMHLAFLSGLLTLVFGHGKRSTALATVVWVLLFCGVAGNTPSVLRSAVMILMLQMAPLLNRERDDMTALGFALLCLLLWNPYSATHVGLQLSFASVSGILLVSEPIQEWMLSRLKLDRYVEHPVLRLLQRIPRFFVSTLAATMGASVFTIPLVAVHFRMISLIAPLANLCTLWAVGLLFVGGLGTGLLGIFWSEGAAVLAVPFAWLARYLSWVTTKLGNIPLAGIQLESVYYRLWVLFLCALIAATLLHRGKRRYIIPVCCAAVTLAASVLFAANTFQQGELAVAVLDVGQGQSVLLRADDYLALVDCGGDGRDNAGDVAADYIQSLGYTSLDLLVVSHYHSDHANGMAQLLKRIDVSLLALPDVEQEDSLRREIEQLAQEQGVEICYVREETHISAGEEQHFVLYPPLGESTQTNELGLTVLATGGENDVLLTGDMGAAQEKVLLDRIFLPDIELLVVGHHGSRTSTTMELLQTVRPETAVISVGAGNRYGHPAAETLERLDSMDIEIYRTDLQGTVMVNYYDGTSNP